jgi:uncharacterized protein (TIGR03435 family)
MPRTPLITALMFCGITAIFAQQPSFEAASIKPAAPMQQGRMMIGMRGGPGTPEPGQMTFTNVSLGNLIEMAYEVKSYQVTGPGWLDSTRFDIAAKVPTGATKEQSRLMLQNLLADRFKLVLHHSTKESSIYALLVAKGGSKLKQSVDDPNAPQSDSPPGQSFGKGGMIAGPTIGKDGMPQLPPGAPRGAAMMMMAPGGKMRMVANNATMSKFIDLLANQLDRPIVDMTGLTGTYDITLDFAPDPSIMQAKMAAMGGGPPPGPVPGGGGPEGASPDPGGAATIFSALPDQLGLRLEARKGPVDLIVIDSARKTPTEN